MATDQPKDNTSHTNAVNASPALGFCPMVSNYGAPTVTFTHGEGTEIWDVDGKRYLDFLCGLAVTSLGHSHPVVADAIAEQASRLMHVSNLYNTLPGPEVALGLDRLIQTFPQPDAQPPTAQLGQVLFQNSGAEANEAAIKLVRRFHGFGRHEIISTFGSFHGRTLATLHATGQPNKHEPFQPLPEGFRHVVYDDVAAVEAAISPTVGAVMVEAVQGEGGVNTPAPGYLRDLRALCDERGLLLILDEVQTGIGRTGAWFAFQHEGITPDIVTIAKGLGNGMPIGAMWAKRDVAQAFQPGDHGSTFAGQPIAASAARAVLGVMEQIDGPALARDRGAELTESLLSLDGVAEVRGMGLLLAAELTRDVLAKTTSAAVAQCCADFGVLVNAVTPTSLRLAPPLTVSQNEIDEAVRLIDGAIQRAIQQNEGAGE